MDGGGVACFLPRERLPFLQKMRKLSGQGKPCASPIFPSPVWHAQYLRWHTTLCQLWCPKSPCLTLVPMEVKAFWKISKLCPGVECYPIFWGQLCLPTVAVVITLLSQVALTPHGWSWWPPALASPVEGPHPCGSLYKVRTYLPCLRWKNSSYSSGLEQLDW